MLCWLASPSIFRHSFDNKSSNMRLAFVLTRQFQRRFIFSVVFLAIFVWALWPCKQDVPVEPVELQEKYPLLWRHVHTFSALGGAWYIPPQWLSSTDRTPNNILDAALLASDAANANKQRQMPHSSIPLILHQTWKNRQIDSWSDVQRDCVERWLEHTVDDGIAYFFWEDDGISRFMANLEPDFLDRFLSLPANVERTDVFRLLVVSHFGGIYADVDTEPLRSPASWISPSDIAPWSDPVMNVTYSSTSNVSLIWGIEADCPPDKNDYWRMGYNSPLQLTQWALASARAHPVLLQFMANLRQRLQSVADRNNGDIRCSNAIEDLGRIGPLSLTGPVAVTVATKSWLEKRAGLRWNALTGLLDGGKSKLVEDVLILPITGFSPGRGRYGNMGSKPVTDPAARVWHHAQGSWRSFDVKIEYGKFCRSAFGLCKDWAKTNM